MAALLRLGAAVDARHKFAGTTALHMAAENGFGDAVSAAVHTVGAAALP